MNEKKYQKRLEFQQKMISRQSEQIESLKLQVEELRLKCEEKDDEIKSVSYLREELSKTVEETKKYKNQYRNLVEELKTMKEIMNQTVFKGKWRLIRFLIK